MKLIGISGKKQSGKDTVCDRIVHLRPHLTVYKYAFADELKQEVAKMLGVTVYHINTYKDKYRPMLQVVGMLRRLEDEYYWVNKVFQKIVQLDFADVVVITDVRFKNEFNKIAAAGGDIIRVEAPTVHSDNHQSETDLDNHAFLNTIFNDKQSFEKLDVQIEQILKKLKL